jgi:type IV pilus assembly protein PilV
MTTTNCRHQNRGQGGFALLEALIAVLIFSLGILGLVGLQAATTQSTSVAKTRVEASFIASQRISDIWGDIANMASKAETDTDISGLGLPNGKRTTAIDGNNVTVTITWKMPKETTVQSYNTVAVVIGG